MTANTLEQRAQLAYETWRDTPADGDSAWPKWRAVVEVLRLSAVEDWVLVPREPTEAMCAAGKLSMQCPSFTSDFDKSVRAYRAMLAARPRQ